MGSGWLKFAIQGSTYARALQNAAKRSGGHVGKPVLDAIAAQPQARSFPGLAQQARAPGPLGAVAPTATQQQLQTQARKIPGTGEGLPGEPGEGHATARFFFKHHFGNRATMQQHPGVAPSPPVSGNAPVMARVKPKGVFPLRPSDPLPNSAFPPARAYTPPVSAAKKPFDAYESTQVLGKRAFITGLENRLPKHANAAAIAAGIGIPLAVGGGMLLSKPGIQSNVKNLFDNKGSTQEQDLGNALPQGALDQAGAIHQALLAHGRDPKTMRIGVDAPPGSGKTTLARALAQHTGMKHYGLDWEPGNAWKSTIGLGRNVEQMPHAPRAGEILEHYLLNRTHDPELFDAQIHLKRDPKLIREQLTRRGNAAYIGDTMDLDKSLGVADLGFDTLGGETIDLGNGTLMKLRPQEGWGNNLDQHLMAKGINPEGLSRHEKLLSLHGGKRTTGAGWTPYVKNPFTGMQTLALGASIPLGVMAARALSRGARVA